DTSGQELFLGRQPILDRNQSLAAFELLFRSGRVNGAQVEDDVFATATVINHAFTELGVEAVLGRHVGFINLSASLLMSDVIELLPKSKVVLEILETVRVTDALAQRCRSLKQAGFTLALDDFTGRTADFEPLLDIVDIVKVDVQDMDHEVLRETTARLKRLKVRLLAEKVDTRARVDECMALGYELFQGYYFARPSIISGRRLSHAESALMRLLSLVLTDSDTAQVEAVFKQNPDLSLKLVKLVNSVGIGGYGEIRSLRSAITMLGRAQLQRWLQVLLFTLGSAPGAEFPSPLLVLAATRGRLMELVAQVLPSREHDLPDRAFMTGILSLVNALLGMPLQDILGSMAIDPEIREALLARTGRLGGLLALVEALEESDMTQIEQALARLPTLDRSRLPPLQVEAMRWANAIGEAV
ncbi:MAG: EAL domain-containing protein, partial [Burkholderiales bacterium]|nr:EAL domain-containing protein [Burkholderiales bacterium]